MPNNTQNRENLHRFTTEPPRRIFRRRAAPPQHPFRHPPWRTPRLRKPPLPRPSSPSPTPALPSASGSAPPPALLLHLRRQPSRSSSPRYFSPPISVSSCFVSVFFSAHGSILALFALQESPVAAGNLEPVVVDDSLSIYKVRYRSAYIVFAEMPLPLCSPARTVPCIRKVLLFNLPLVTSCK